MKYVSIIFLIAFSAILIGCEKKENHYEKTKKKQEEIKNEEMKIVSAIFKDFPNATSLNEIASDPCWAYEIQAKLNGILVFDNFSAREIIARDGRYFFLSSGYLGYQCNTDFEIELSADMLPLFKSGKTLVYEKWIVLSVDGTDIFEKKVKIKGKAIKIYG